MTEEPWDYEHQSFDPDVIGEIPMASGWDSYHDYIDRVRHGWKAPDIYLLLVERNHQCEFWSRRLGIDHRNPRGPTPEPPAPRGSSQ